MNIYVYISSTTPNFMDRDPTGQRVDGPQTWNPAQHCHQTLSLPLPKELEDPRAASLPSERNPEPLSPLHWGAKPEGRVERASSTKAAVNSKASSQPAEASAETAPGTAGDTHTQHKTTQAWGMGHGAWGMEQYQGERLFPPTWSRSHSP